MFTVTTTYVTKHGIDLKDYTLFIEGVNFSSNTFGNLSHDKGVYPNALQGASTVNNINYRVSAYTSPAGAAQGLLGLPVVLKNGDSGFFLSGHDIDMGSVSDILQACREHFISLLK